MCRARRAPLAGDPEASAAFSRASGTNTSVQAAVGVHREVATLNMYMKNLGSLGIIWTFLPLLRLP